MCWTHIPCREGSMMLLSEGNEGTPPQQTPKRNGGNSLTILVKSTKYLINHSQVRLSAETAEDAEINMQINPPWVNCSFVMASHRLPIQHKEPVELGFYFILFWIRTFWATVSTFFPFPPKYAYPLPHSPMGVWATALPILNQRSIKHTQSTPNSLRRPSVLWELTDVHR